MLTGLLRMFALGVILLLSIATTTTLVQPAGPITATTSSATSATPSDVDATDGKSYATLLTTTQDDGLTEECDTEVSACHGDATCLDCMTVYTASNGCPADLVSESPTSAETCEILLYLVCCIDYLSELDCLDNGQFVEYWMCYFGTIDCSEQELVCVDDDATEGASNDATSTDSMTTAASFGRVSTAVVTLSCAFVLLLAVL